MQYPFAFAHHLVQVCRGRARSLATGERDQLPRQPGGPFCGPKNAERKFRHRVRIRRSLHHGAGLRGNTRQQAAQVTRRGTAQVVKSLHPAGFVQL